MDMADFMRTSIGNSDDDEERKRSPRFGDGIRYTLG